MLQPLARRTWAPRGQTPIQYAWDRHDRVSAIAALTLSPARKRIGLNFQLYERNIRAENVADFLRQLHRSRGTPVTLVCDRYSVHKKAVRLIEETGGGWLRVEYLPAYAPELNPVEALWSHGKYSQLANFIPDDADHLFDAVAETLNDQSFRCDLKRSCFNWAELPL
jgi:transposase